MRKHIAITTLVSLVSAACSGEIELPPPQAPNAQAEAPSVDYPETEPARGQGRIVLETPHKQAQVVEVTHLGQAQVGRYSMVSVATRPVCTTPCVVDMSYGTHHLAFASTSDPERKSFQSLEVTARPKLVRHELGRRVEHPFLRSSGTALMTLGLSAAIVGGILWGVAAANKSDGSDGLESAGRLTTIGGLGAMGISLPLLILGRTEVQPGATTEVPLGGPTRAPETAVQTQLTLAD